MDNRDFSSFQSKEIMQFASVAAPAEIKAAAEHFSEEQIPIFFTAINHLHEKNWMEKTQAALTGLNSKKLLEKAGSALTNRQFFSLLELCTRAESPYRRKIPPLLVGMPHEMFIEVMEYIDDKHLEVFKNEGVTEPIQHHLTTLTHYLENQVEEGELRIDQLHEQVDRFQIEELGLYDVREIIKEVELNLLYFERQYQISNKALAIAWNTNRPDLVESLNAIKESFHKCILYGLGSPRKEQQVPTGIFQQIEESLFAVYGDGSFENNAKAVRDSEPAVEGLAMLSIWYLRDYWELGLLPQVKDQKDLDLDLDKHSEVERVRYREGLFSTVKENLASIDLVCVKDLKDRYIFSKKSLQEYIQEKMPT